MKIFILLYLVLCTIGCTTAQKRDDYQNNCAEMATAQEKLSKRVTSPVPNQGFGVLADSLFALCYPIYDSIPKNLDGHFYFDIHLYISNTGELLHISLDYSKIFESYFESQKDRVSLILKDWRPAVDKISIKPVSYSVNILSKLYGQKHEIVFSNIQHDTLARFTRPR